MPTPLRLLLPPSIFAKIYVDDEAIERYSRRALLAGVTLQAVAVRLFDGASGIHDARALMRVDEVQQRGDYAQEERCCVAQ